ncbi:MAG: hypothetical protein IKL65_01465 [Bacilli bacterium]|nr:hypothetical protein [Bacilli bacterium]
MKKKTTIGEKISVFFISLLCMIIIFPFLSYFIDDTIMWNLIPIIPLLSFLIAVFYVKLKK